MCSAGNSSQYRSFATDEQLKTKWDEAVRMGFFSPTIEKIYDLEIGDDTSQEHQAANEGKFEAKPTANEVLRHSLVVLLSSCRSCRGCSKAGCRWSWVGLRGCL